MQNRATSPLWDKRKKLLYQERFDWVHPGATVTNYRLPLLAAISQLTACRFIQAIYLEKIDGNVKLTGLVERLANLDCVEEGRMVFEDTAS